jgi:SMODS and SLOG-associating 2TM effector domain 1
VTGQAAADRAEQFAELYTEARIDDQLGFYTRNRAENEKAYDQAIRVKWTLSTLAAIAGAVGAALPQARTALAIAAAFLAAAATAMAAYQSLYAFPRLAKLYRDAELSLSTLAAAREAMGRGVSLEQARAHVERIEKVFSQENGQWGQLVRHSTQPSDQSAGDQSAGDQGAGDQGASDQGASDQGEGNG